MTRAGRAVVRCSTPGMPHPWYEFERLTHDLSWPPLAALRAFEAAGVRVSRDGWKSLPFDARLSLAHLGAGATVDPHAVRSVLAVVPPREIALRPPHPDVTPVEVPGAVVAALRLTGQPASQFWEGLAPLDRYTLFKLAHNTRLLLQAITEMAVRSKQWDYAVSPKKWTGMIAHCEVRMGDEAAARIESEEVLEGRACVLARVAGIRAARSACDLLDMHRETTTGAIEIGSAIRHDAARSAVIWQAHVSSADGSFFPAASLLAVTTAAAALHDIVRVELEGDASVDAGHLANEPWCVGWADGDTTVSAK